MTKVKVTIVTTNNFKNEASYLQWKRAMQSQLSIVDFDELEKTSVYNIESGTDEDGSSSTYVLEVTK